MTALTPISLSGHQIGPVWRTRDCAPHQAFPTIESIASSSPSAQRAKPRFRRHAIHSSPLVPEDESRHYPVKPSGKTMVTLVPLGPDGRNGAPTSPEFQRLCFERMKLDRRHFLYTMTSPPCEQFFSLYSNHLRASTV
jgi:hypothetical protein